MNRAPVFWTRELKDGWIEFFMRASGASHRGCANGPEVLDVIRVGFEKNAHQSLPLPEHKRPRGKWAEP